MYPQELVYRGEEDTALPHTREVSLAYASTSVSIPLQVLEHQSCTISYTVSGCILSVTMLI